MHLRFKVVSVIGISCAKLCNGIPLITTKLKSNVIVANILSGAMKGEECSHVIFYVVCSRVGKLSSQLAPENKRKNIVYHAKLC